MDVGVLSILFDKSFLVTLEKGGADGTPRT